MPRARVRRVPQRTARPQRMRGVKSPTRYRTPQSTRTIRGMGMGVGMEVAPYYMQLGRIEAALRWHQGSFWGDHVLVHVRLGPQVAVQPTQ
jgi:hypothetical protein